MAKIHVRTKSFSLPISYSISVLQKLHVSVSILSSRMYGMIYRFAGLLTYSGWLYLPVMALTADSGKKR